MECIKSRLGFHGCFVVEVMGRTEGLALLWKEDNDMVIYNFSRMHISSWVEDSKNHFKWLSTSFYGESITSRWHNSQQLLRALKPSEPRPQMVLRDFNEILFHHEKLGGQQREERLMQRFRRMHQSFVVNRAWGIMVNFTNEVKNTRMILLPRSGWIELQPISNGSSTLIQFAWKVRQLALLIISIQF